MQCPTWELHSKSQASISFPQHLGAARAGCRAWAQHPLCSPLRREEEPMADRLWRSQIGSLMGGKRGPSPLTACGARRTSGGSMGSSPGNKACGTAGSPATAPSSIKHREGNRKITVSIQSITLCSKCRKAAPERGRHVLQYLTSSLFVLCLKLNNTLIT